MSNTSNTIVGALAGAAIGVVAGLLFAPEKGEQLRSRIASETKNATDKLQAEAARIQKQVAESFSVEKKTMEDQLKDIIDNAGDDVEKMIDKLEDKLTALKNQNHQLEETV